MTVLKDFNEVTNTWDAIFVGAQGPPGTTNGALNVKDFGAKGDGTTDDTASIQAALTTAGATGGTVHFPRGTYTVGLTTSQYALTVPSNVTIRGDGRASILRRDPANPGGLLYGNAVTKVSVLHMAFDCSGDEVSNPNTYTGGGHEGVRFLNSSYIVIDDVYIERCLSWALSFRTCTDSTVTRVVFNTGGDRTGGGLDGLHLLSCARVTAHDISGVSGDNLIGITSQGGDCNDIAVTDVTGYTLMHIDVVRICQEAADPNTNIYNVTVDNVKVTGQSQLARIINLGTGRTDKITMSNCISLNNGTGSSSPLTLNKATNVNLMNLHLANSAAEGVIMAGCSAVRIRGCVVSNMGDASNSTRSGINIASSSSDVIVSDCIANDNAYCGFQSFECKRVSFINCVAYDNCRFSAGNGFRIYGGSAGANDRNTLIGCRAFSTAPGTFMQNSGFGISSGGFVTNLIFADNMAWDNTTNYGTGIPGATIQGFYGTPPIARPTVSAAAIDPATTQALVNSIRTALIALGLTT